MSDITIKLDTPLVGHGAPISEVVIREPRFEEWRLLGDPYVISQTPEGMAFVAEKADVIREYEDLLVKAPGMHMLAQADFRVARKVRQAVLSFFLPGGEADEASTTSPTISSSSDNSQQRTSSE